MSPYPICPVCPSCGCLQFKKVRADGWVYFTEDHLCLACQTRYTPPTPTWAVVTFVLCGLFLILFCGSALLWAIAQQAFQGIPLNAACTALGVASLLYATRAASQ